MSSFVLKLIAAVTMFIDHAGLILFPAAEFMRIIGRLAFPLYAYCIAEGFRYTKDRFRYFMRVAVLGILCQIVYTIVDGEIYLGILISFSIAIIILALIDAFRKANSGKKSPLASLIERFTKKNLSPRADRVISAILCVLAIGAAFVLCVTVEVDYGFFGIMLPVFTNLFTDKHRRLVMFSAALLALCIDLTDTFVLQYWSLLTVPLIALYNGKKGRFSMKYFFYIFYPAHLVLLYAIDMVI